MLKKIRMVMLGALAAGLLCYACIGMNNATVLASSCQKSSSATTPACCAEKQGTSPCHLLKDVGLTPEQQAKVDKLEAECKKGNVKCGTECLQKIKLILTKEQGEKLDALIAAKQGAGGPKCGAGKQPGQQPGGPPCDLTKELGLTPDQQGKLEKLKASCEKNGMKCTPECREKMMGILTKEQAAKLEAIIAKMMGGCSKKH